MCQKQDAGKKKTKFPPVWDIMKHTFFLTRADAESALTHPPLHLYLHARARLFLEIARIWPYFEISAWNTRCGMSCVVIGKYTGPGFSKV